MIGYRSQNGNTNQLPLGLSTTGELVVLNDNGEGPKEICIMELIRELQFTKKYLSSIKLSKKTRKFLLKGALGIIDLENV